MPLYLPAVGGALASVVYILFVQLESMAVSWLCLASFLAGIFGGVTSVIASCFSYVAALTDKDSRTLRSVVSRHTHCDNVPMLQGLHRGIHELPRSSCGTLHIQGGERRLGVGLCVRR